MSLSSSGGYPQGRSAGGCRGRFSPTIPLHSVPANASASSGRRWSSVSVAVLVMSWRSVFFLLIGCVRPGRFRVAFFFARDAIFFRFFLRRISFFCIFVAVNQFSPWLSLCFHQLLPWWLLSAFLSCALRLLASWSASPRAPAPLLRCGSRPRVRPSRVRWSVGVSALGGRRGRSRCWLLGRGAW